MKSVRALAWAAALLSGSIAILHCGKKASSASADGASNAALVVDGATSPAEGGAEAEDPRATDLWTRAHEGDLDDLERLHAYVGSDVLVAASSNGSRRLTALRALAFEEDFYALPFLATVATSGSEDEARVALESVETIASEPRRAVDPEDALELHEGWVALIALTKDPTRPPARRALAVAVLKRLADRGSVPRAELATELDAH